MAREIQIYGDKAELINDGDRFVATVSSAEGHKVVTLHKLPWVEE